TAQDHPVDVDRRTPVDLFAADHERAGRPRVDAEPGADPGAFSAGAVAPAATGASLDARRGDHGDAVLLVGVTEDALDADHVPGSFDRLADIALRVHVGLLRRRRPSHPPPAVANVVVTPRASVAVGGKGLVQPVDRVDEAPAVGGRNRSFVDGFGHLVLQVLKRVARVASMAVAFAV